MIRLSVVMKRPGLLAIALALVVGVQSVRSEGARLSRTQQNPVLLRSPPDRAAAFRELS